LVESEFNKNEHKFWWKVNSIKMNINFGGK